MTHRSGPILIGALILALFFLRDGAVPANKVFAALVAVIVAFALGVPPRPGLDVRRAGAYLVYLAALTISMLMSRSAEALTEYGRQLLFLGLIFGVARLTTTDLVARRLLALVLLSTFLVLLSALGFGAWVDTDSRPVFYGSVPQWSGYPELGMLAAMAASACLAAMAAGEAAPLRLSSLVLGACFAAAAFLLYSRSAWVTIAAVAAWVAVVAVLRWRRWKVSIAVVVLAATAVVAASSSSLVGRYLASLSAATSSGEVAIRSRGWQVAARMLTDHPVFGVGPGNFAVRFPQYSDSPDRSHAYNLVLHTSAELGLAGVACYLAIWARALLRSYRAAGPSGGGLHPFMVHAMLAAFLVRSQGEHFLATSLPTALRLLLLVGFLIGLTEAHGSRPVYTGAAGKSG